MKQQCYLCQVSDPNETPFNPKEHRICMICGVKLWELAQEGIEFDLREQTVHLTATTATRPSKASREAARRTAMRPRSDVAAVTRPARNVTLTTGYQVDLEDEEG